VKNKWSKKKKEKKNPSTQVVRSASSADSNWRRSAGEFSNIGDSLRKQKRGNPRSIADLIS
jgi:hypothetical protein